MKNFFLLFPLIFPFFSFAEIYNSNKTLRLIIVKSSQDSIKFLLLDKRIIESTENVKLEVGKVKKHSLNPLFKEEKDWEMRFDNLYANVIYDQEEKIYKCWYSPFIIDSPPKNKAIGEIIIKYQPPPVREMGICYATSIDGIKWEKPNLGLVNFNGNKKNNIVWRRPHGAGIFKDLNEKNTARRYKLIYKHIQEGNWGLNGSEGNSLAVSFSKDGLSWSDKINIADFPADTHNNANWIPNLNKYVAITRDWVKTDDKERVERAVVRIESDDFVKWENPKVVLIGEDSDLQTYAMPYFSYEGVFIGLVAIHDQKSDRVWTELAWSRDTIKWDRIDIGNPLIPNSEKIFDYDYGCIYAAVKPIIKKNEIQIFYASSDYLHSGWRNGSFSLATLRPDGFAGYIQKNIDENGIIITKKLNSKNKEIRLTADVENGGFVSVSVLNSKGNEIANSKLLKKTITDGVLKFDNKINEELIKLQIRINKAKVYSFMIN
tara:strand:- start:6258 stop:7724 length:1467 start_codon:yes stop_codon:yes gene_type:complete